MKSIKRLVWINFFVAIVAVNVVSELGYYFTGIFIPIPLRLAFITGITVGMTILIGAMVLVMNMSKEVPHSTYARDTLAFDRNHKHTPEELKKLEKIEQNKQDGKAKEK